MSNMNEFTLSKNKELLWKLMCDNKNFVKMVQKDIQHIQVIFENKINEIITISKDKNIKLLTLNKDFLKNMNSFCNKTEPIKNKNKDVVFDKNINNNVITREDIQKKELNSFDERLNKRQQEFDKYKNDKPEEVNFNDDKIDEPLKDIDNILKSKIAERNYEVQNVEFKGSAEETDNWLGINETENNNTLNIENIKNIHNNIENIEISIDETLINETLINETPINETPINDITINDNNIFSKLKTETPNMDRNIISKLDLIIENQNTILDLLKNKNY